MYNLSARVLNMFDYIVVFIYYFFHSSEYSKLVQGGGSMSNMIKYRRAVRSKECRGCIYMTWHDGLICMKGVSCKVGDAKYDGLPHIENNFACNKFEKIHFNQYQLIDTNRPKWEDHVSL